MFCGKETVKTFCGRMFGFEGVGDKRKDWLDISAAALVFSVSEKLVEKRLTFRNCGVKIDPAIGVRAREAFLFIASPQY